MPQALPYIATAATVYGATRGGGGTQTVQQEVDPQTQARYEDIYGRAKGVAQQPFIPYTGPMVAGFSPDQLRQFQATRGIFESGMAFDPTKGLQTLAQEQRPTVAPVGSLLTADIGAYQSPYQQQVIDATMRDIQRQADIARTGAQERAIRAGAFGGSRSAILEAESQRPFAEVMARTAAEQRERGYGQALRAAESDIARQQQMAQFAPQFELQARQQQAGLLGGLAGQQLQGLGLLGGIGQQQQALQQRAIEAQRGEFARALDYPRQQLGLLQGAVFGMSPRTTQATGYSPSSFERLQAGLNAYQTAQPFFSNLFSPAQTPTQLPQVNLPTTLPGTGGYPIG